MDQNRDYKNDKSCYIRLDSLRCDQGAGDRAAVFWDRHHGDIIALLRGHGENFPWADRVELFRAVEKQNAEHSHGAYPWYRWIAWL